MRLYSFVSGFDGLIHGGREGAVIFGGGVLILTRPCASVKLSDKQVPYFNQRSKLYKIFVLIFGRAYIWNGGSVSKYGGFAQEKGGLYSEVYKH